MTHTPYPAYRPTDLPWLAQIPAHWDLTSVKRGYDIRLGKMLRSEPLTTSDTLEPYLRAANIQWQDVNTEDVKKMWVSPWEKPLYELQEGDLMVCEGGDVGRAAIWQGQVEKCYIQNSVHRVRSREGFINKFLYYWLIVLKNGGYIDLLCNKATIAHFTAEKFADIALIVPPLPEQRTIAAFLDRQTAKIDALIAKKGRLLDLLAEKRAALISRAVTKGLNPNAEMKDSGVAWLGQVPSHWEKKKIKHVVRQIIDTEHKTAPFYLDGEYFVVRTSNVKKGKLVFDDAKYTDLTGYEEWTKRGKPQPGDILFTREAPAGEACIVPENLKLCVGQRTVLLKIDHEKIASQFCIWSVYSGLASEFIQILSQGSTVVHFNMPDISNIPLLLPTIEEQVTIVDYLEKETYHLDSLITKIEIAIARLREYRAALISAAVTGKIQVKDE